MHAPPAPERPEFQRRQYEFAAHIRDPGSAPAPADVEDRRMEIYRDLFYRNVEGLLSGNFPVLRRVLGDERWHALVRGFFAVHRSRTPLFPEIGQEFIEYLQQERAREETDPPFMLELAHYEWVELALAISDDDRRAAPADPNGDLMEGRPVLSPLAWSLTYAWPVHRISPAFQPEEPDALPTHLVVYRDRADEVRFVEVNAVTQRLLELAKENPGHTGLELVSRIAEELAHPDPAAVIQAGAQLLADLRQKDIVLGTAA